MLQQRKGRAEAGLEVEKGRELLEDELAAICGGHASAGSPGETGLGDSYGFPNLTNLLSPQGPAANTKGKPGSSADKNAGFPDLGPLSNLTGGLFGKLF